MAVITPTRHGPARLRRPAGVISAGLSLVAYVVSAPGALGSDYAGYVWAARLFDHQFLLGILGCGLSALSLVLLLSGRHLGACLLAALGLGALWSGWAALGAAFAPSQHERLSGVENPDRTLRTRVLLSGIVDPLYEVQVEQTDRGMLNRRFTVGCLSGDALSIDRLRWQDGALMIDSSAGTIAVTVGDDGRPGETRSIADGSIDEGPEGPVGLHAC